MDWGESDPGVALKLIASAIGGMTWFVGLLLSCAAYYQDRRYG